MAISPNLLNEKLQQEASIIEKRLDHTLSNSRFQRDRGYITLSIPSGMNRGHFEILRQRYINAGWKDMIWHSDQRDGDYLEFTA